MRRLDASAAELLVFTCREGMLAAIGHDLQLRLTRFTLSVDRRGAEMTALLEADPSSLMVVTALRDGRPYDTLTRADRDHINTAITDAVLQTRRYPRLRCQAHGSVQGDAVEWTGELELHGARHPVAGQALRQGAVWVTRIELQQPEHGIRPYTTMLGMLRVKPGVLVQVTVPQQVS